MHLLNRPERPCMAISASERAFFERLGTRIAELRKGQDITQVEMAKILGVASNKDLARKLASLERSLVALDLKTQRQFKEVYEAIRQLMNPPAPKRVASDLPPISRRSHSSLTESTRP